MLAYLSWFGISVGVYVLLALGAKLGIRDISFNDQYVSNQNSIWGEMLYVLPSITIFGTAVMFHRHLIRGPKSAPVDLKGKTMIVTGANSGIGFETAKQLAGMNAHVIMACRSRERAKEAMEKIMQVYPDAKLTIMIVDVSSLQSVKSFVKEFKKLNLSLHALINNAGVFQQTRNVTEDGIEMTMATNHFGHFLLTNELLNKLSKTGGRIVNVGSCMHKFVNYNICEDIMLEKKYGFFRAYNQSKMANMLFTRGLAKRVANTKVTVNCVHPGLTSTDITRRFPRWLEALQRNFDWLGRILFKTAEEGAYTVVFAATAPQLEKVSGQYLNNCDIVSPNATSQDDKIADEFWELSTKIVKNKRD